MKWQICRRKRDPMLLGVRCTEPHSCIDYIHYLTVTCKVTNLKYTVKFDK